MGRRLAAAIALVALLLLLAWGLFSLAFGPSRSAPPVPRPIPTKITTRVAPAHPSLKATPAEDSERIKVVSLEGRVERRTGDQPWTALEAGQELRQDDAIRTGHRGRVVLGLAGASTVEVSPRSEFTVAEISRRVARVRMQEGRLSAVIREGSGRLKVEARGSDAVAESGAGAFSVLASGKGQLTVAATEGTVTLASASGKVVVNAGEQSVARLGQAPSAPSAIPHSLFLKIGKPPSLQRSRELVIAGRTAPGAVVMVNGVRGETEADGRFSLRVALRDGRNLVRVEAEDAAGKRRARTVPVVVKSRVEPVDARVVWGAGGDGT